MSLTRSLIRTISLLAAAGVPTMVFGQVYTEPQSAPASQSAASESPSGSAAGSDAKSDSPQFLGHDIPLLDPGSEIVSWDGHNWNIANNRILQARFEKYLNTEEADSAKDREYRETLDAILAALSPRGAGPKLARATALMEKAAQYPIDARLCDSLANAIYGVWLARRSVTNLRRANAELDKELRRASWNVEGASTESSLSGSRQRESQHGEVEKQRLEMKKELRDASRLGSYLRKVVEIHALRTKNQVEMAASEVQAKIEFQALMVQFFLQRRFEHVIISSRTYRVMFGDGDSSLKLDQASDAAEIFRTGIGVNPTIVTLDAFANEAMRDVDEGVRAFRFLVERGELAGASRRLTEAFAVGEYLPRIRTVPRSEKRKVLGFVQDSNQLISALDVKDYALAESLVNKLKEISADFDFSKPMAAIQTAKTVADMHIQQALLAAQRGNDQEVRDQMQKALEIYPTNPRLAEMSDRIVRGSDVRGQAIDDLDRLVAEGNFRTIFKNQGRFIAAVFDDPQRQTQLQQILENVQKIDVSIEQAERLDQNGTPEAAWEVVEKLYAEFPEDATLSAVRSDLATNAADFVRTLRTAAKLEDRRQVGSSLAWYLRARQIYPHSTYAREGIERLVDQILPEDGARSDDPAADFGAGIGDPSEAE